jgi:L-serine/L-threonine ammonia-lyase
MNLWVRTPVIPSEPLSALCGRPVWLKLESAQPAGSFKQRGMSLACARAVAHGATVLVSSSGGNAGYAVAWAGRRLGVPVEVVVPGRTSPMMRARIASEGASVRVVGEVWDDAHEAAVALAAERGGALMHPFDGPDIWEGHASLVHELAQDLPEPPGLVVVSVGGGGLLAGVLRGLDDVGWRPEILACETHGTASFAAAMAAGEPVTLPSVSGLALTLGSRRVCDEVVRRALAARVHLSAVSDDDAMAAVRAFADDHRILVEAACGAALAPVRAGGLPGAGPVVVIVCGGASATRETVG